jgi:hypothetical protein
LFVVYGLWVEVDPPGLIFLCKSGFLPFDIFLLIRHPKAQEQQTTNHKQQTTNYFNTLIFILR